MKNFIFTTVASLGLICTAELNAQRNDQKPSVSSRPQIMEQSVPKTLSQSKRENPYNKPKWDVPAHESYIAYPPVDKYGHPMCTPSYYGGNPQCPYQYYEGYFWYPQAQGNLLASYTPYYDTKNYWYPSRMHPHKVYVERASLVFTYPHPLDAPMYEQQYRPMEKKWETAPEMHSAEDY